MATDKKDNIINAAIELFAEKGFEGTSIRELALKADVNVAMVNYYFGSKDKLFEAMVEQKAVFTREVLEVIANDKTKTEIEKIDAIIDSYVNRLLSNHKYHRVIHQELLLQQRKGLHEMITSVFSKNRDIIKAIIDAGMKKKVFKKVDPELTLVSMIGTINQVLLSKTMCTMLMQYGEGFDPYTNDVFKKRLINHIKQMMHAHLLNN